MENYGKSERFVMLVSELIIPKKESILNLNRSLCGIVVDLVAAFESPNVGVSINGGT